MTIRYWIAFKGIPQVTQNTVWTGEWASMTTALVFLTGMAYLSTANSIWQPTFSSLVFLGYATVKKIYNALCVAHYSIGHMCVRSV